MPPDHIALTLREPTFRADENRVGLWVERVAVGVGERDTADCRSLRERHDVTNLREPDATGLHRCFASHSTQSVGLFARSGFVPSHHTARSR